MKRSGGASTMVFLPEDNTTVMKTINHATVMQQWTERQAGMGRTIGFVPTMGALHEGHLSLVRRSVAENDVTVCSVFVNPIQFNSRDDLRNYPRMPETDLGMLSDAGCDLAFVPSEEEIYPAPIDKVYSFGHLDRVMEGAFRPGHFNGVAIVVDRLFRLVGPTCAYFGMKDYQQLMVIREMVRQEGHRTRIVGCPIVRESDGLAMSSRNMRLTREQREVASQIYSALRFAAESFRSFSVKALEEKVMKRLSEIPGARAEYATISEAETLLPVTAWHENREAVLCVALYLGDIRLIDNIILE
jgi:pantoate--beta-alanine ligase